MIYPTIGWWLVDTCSCGGSPRSNQSNYTSVQPSQYQYHFQVTRHPWCSAAEPQHPQGLYSKRERPKTPLESLPTYQQIPPCSFEARTWDLNEEITKVAHGVETMASRTTNGTLAVIQSSRTKEKIKIPCNALASTCGDQMLDTSLKTLHSFNLCSDAARSIRAFSSVLRSGWLEHSQ